MIERTLSAPDVTLIGDPEESFTGRDDNGRGFTITRHGNAVISTTSYGTDVFIEPTPEAARGTFATLTEDVDSDQAHAAPRVGDLLRAATAAPAETVTFMVKSVNRRLAPEGIPAWDVERIPDCDTVTLVRGEFEIVSRPLPLCAVVDLSDLDADGTFAWRVARGNAAQESGMLHLPAESSSERAWELFMDGFLTRIGFRRVSDWTDVERVDGGVDAVAEVKRAAVTA